MEADVVAAKKEFDAKEDASMAIDSNNEDPCYEEITTDQYGAVLPKPSGPKGVEYGKKRKTYCGLLEAYNGVQESIKIGEEVLDDEKKPESPISYIVVPKVPLENGGLEFTTI